jgi:hypothetical protein
LLLKEELEAPKPPALLFIVSLGFAERFRSALATLSCAPLVLRRFAGGLQKFFQKKLQFFNFSILQFFKVPLGFAAWLCQELQFFRSTFGRFLALRWCSGASRRSCKEFFRSALATLCLQRILQLFYTTGRFRCVIAV